MLERVGNYFSERRRGLFTAAGVSGTVYLGGKYMSQRIEEMREEAVQVQRAKENLRRRFEQNQEDVMFTIMAHLPTLGKGVVEGMDVEAVTKELQARSKKARKGGVASGSGGNDPGIGGGRTGIGSGVGTGIGTGGTSYILGGVREPSPNPPTSESSLASSVELLNPNNFGSSTVVTHNANNNNNVVNDNENENTRGRAISMSTTDPLSAITESSGFGGGVEGAVGGVTGGHAPSTSSQSWVDEFSSESGYLAQSQNSLFGPVLAIPPAPSSSGGGREPTLVSPVSNVTGTGSGVGISVGVGTETGMSGSFLSDSMVSSARSSVIYSDDEREISSLNTKSKAELWQEIKILTFTRTLTIIYSATLLSLLTTLQLNILGRSKYVQSVKQLMREERVREKERRQMQISIPSLILGGLMGFGGFGGGLGGLGGGDEELFSGLGLGSRFGLGTGLGSVFGIGGGDTDEDEFEDGVEGGEDEDREFVTPEAERKFLTLSWWLLYMGWKDIGERVRRSVEEVFEGVSLKTRLGPKDLHRLICDVRRRVEHEITYEGTERRINFLSSIIPPSPETLSLCFSEGGVPGYRSSDIIAQHALPPSTSSSLNTLSTPHPLTQTLTQTQAQAQASSSRTQYPHSHIPTHVQEQQRQQQQNNPYFPPSSPSPSHLPPTVPQSKSPEPLQHTRPSPPLHSHSYPQSQQPHPLQPPPMPSSSPSYPRAPRSRPDPESDKVFGRLLGELRCTAASPVFGALLEGALERAVEVMFEDVRRRVFGGGVDGAEGGGGGNAEGGDGEGGRTGRSEEEEGEKPRLANMLPELAKWAHSALDTVPNELVDSIVGLKETTALAAIIYSSYEYPPLS